MITPNMYTQLSDDAAMIQAAVDEAAKTGDSVTIPKKNERTGENLWDLSRSIKLYTGSTILLDSCTLRMADDSLENFFVNASYNKPICPENRQKNIRISGIGDAVLDGGRHNGIFEYSFMEYDENANFLGRKTVQGLSDPSGNIGIRLVNVEGITLQNLRFRNPRYWSIACYYCTKGHIADIVFDTGAEYPNLDGIDIRSGCSDFIIENISGNTGDDTVALTTLWDLKENAPGQNMDIHDIIIRNIHSRLSSHCDTIRLLNQGGARIYNVLIDGVFDLSTCGSADRPLAAIRIGDLNDFGMPHAAPGDTYNITVRNVHTRARFGLYIAKTLTDSLIENVSVFDDGGMLLYANQCYMENVTLRDVGYTRDAVQPDFYIGYRHIPHRVLIDRLAGMYFAACSGKNVRVQGFVTGKDLPAAFAGHDSSLEIKAEDVVFLHEDTRLSDGVAVTAR